MGGVCECQALLISCVHPPPPLPPPPVSPSAAAPPPAAGTTSRAAATAAGRTRTAAPAPPPTPCMRRCTRGARCCRARSTSRRGGSGPAALTMCVKSGQGRQPASQPALTWHGRGSASVRPLTSAAPGWEHGTAPPTPPWGCRCWALFPFDGCAAAVTTRRRNVAAAITL